MNNLKFGVSYNVFDGEELLEDSILHIRDLVDYISVVYQKVSNWGSPCSDNLMDILNNLKNKKLIDNLIEYQPINGIHINEVNKRNIGLSLSKENGCTHHMTMDCDEFYKKDQFTNLINWYRENPNNVGYCSLVNYYKNSNYRILKEDDTHVTLFFPVENTSFNISVNTPVLIDPTRKPTYSHYNVFSSDFIVMHHMTMVRNDLSSKLMNSSARLNYNNVKRINDIVEDYRIFNGDRLKVLSIFGHIDIKEIEKEIILTKFDNNNIK